MTSLGSRPHLKPHMLQTRTLVLIVCYDILHFVVTASANSSCQSKLVLQLNFQSLQIYSNQRNCSTNMELLVDLSCWSQIYSTQSLQLFPNRLTIHQIHQTELNHIHCIRQIWVQYRHWIHSMPQVNLPIILIQFLINGAESTSDNLSCAMLTFGLNRWTLGNQYISWQSHLGQSYVGHYRRPWSRSCVHKDRTCWVWKSAPWSYVKRKDK